MDAQASSSKLTPATFDTFNSGLQASALKTTRNATTLPADIPFHRSMDPSFSEDLDRFSSRVLSLANNLLDLVAAANTTQSTRAKGKAKLETQDDVVDNFHPLVVDSMDYLLEKTDICLDQYLGRTKPAAIAVNLVTPAPRKSVLRGQLDASLQHASHIQKPQLSFKKKVENSELPWYPSIPHKYHASVPLGYIFHETTIDPNDNTPMTTHPYYYEITHISYPQRIFQSAVPILPKPLEDTPFSWVSNTQGLHSMLLELRKAEEIAIDLEHHNYRSYGGFVCLMQVSTREADWIVDTLALREELTELNEIFADPKILKVFHGADSDIIWLQQDFNLYIVNLFDTYHASKLLEFPRHSLANLLEMYCDFTPDKRYQLADWRIRPLPEEMLQYARSDTHFLLYIYDNLRNALLDRALSRSRSRAQSLSPSGSPHDSTTDPSHALIRKVLTHSEETALRTYQKEGYDTEGGTGSNGWDTLARKWNKNALLAGGPGVGVGAFQRAVYISIHKWRDYIAREEDESTRYVLPNHYLFRLAEQPPADIAALLNVFHPVPPVIKRRAKELLDVIKGCISPDTSLSSVLGPAEQSPMIANETETSQISNIIPETVTSTLWSLASKTNSIVAPSSSLFTPPLVADQKAQHSMLSLTTSRSSLFGSMIRNLSSSLNKSRPDSTRFQELASRINSQLVVVPSVPKVQITEENIAVDGLNAAHAPVLGVEVEIPYIPTSHRKPVHVVDDSIVVVGQARQRKRKRTKGTLEGVDSNALAEGSNLQNTQTSNDELMGSQEPFDFSTVPNILDDNPNPEDTIKKKKQKKQKNSGAFYGDFPAPPKAHSELKRGNQSHTFK